MNKIRRIGLFGGPGAGKSTTAALLYTSIKNQLIHNNSDTKIELVQEYVKEWAWEGTRIRGFDQAFICMNQLRREEIPLRAGVDTIITDSPLLLQCAYSMKNNVPGWHHLIGISHEFEKQYPSINIVLDRGDRPYVSHGRYENYNQAVEMDEYIEKFLISQCVRFKKIKSTDINLMMEYYIDEERNGK